MSIFAIGDTHLSLMMDKPMDIFRGWDDYVSRLEKNWRAVVSDKDTVIIPGDISWAMRIEEAQADFAFLHSLPGKKIFLKGNHDYWWVTMKKINDFISANGFDSIKILYNNAYEVENYAVCGSRGWFFDDMSENSEKVIAREAGRLRRSIEEGLKLERELIVFLHYPPVSDLQICEEIMEVLVEYKIKRCFFGHVHAEKTGRYEKFEHSGIVFSLVSSDFLKFCPKLIV